MKTMFEKFFTDDNGATAIEYGLISAIMAVALLSGFGAFSNSMSNQFLYLSNTMTNSWK
ncbi:Flp family type IVb pilin [Rhizobium sp. TH2]|uniref:Flp family type IVb pilin n=1 Tax=Rhizobium sp. TH2 TaxID=2775403 RepID=UPI0021578FE5|nr:Flp family type IVb pilin [Rhizobium sp. TH2]UVC08696.1 Flp family type IVb pilin [Rhizobium sp. TH2]